MSRVNPYKDSLLKLFCNTIFKLKTVKILQWVFLLLGKNPVFISKQKQSEGWRSGLARRSRTGTKQWPSGPCF